MGEAMCRVSAEMNKDGSIAVHITGSSVNMVQCLGGLVKAVADFSEVSTAKVAFDALFCSAETTMTDRTVVPAEVYEAARKWKERQDG